MLTEKPHLQHFVAHETGEHGTVAGIARELPLNPDLSVEDGPLVAADCLYWVAQNMPGFDYQRKAKIMVRHFTLLAPKTALVPCSHCVCWCNSLFRTWTCSAGLEHFHHVPFIIAK